LNHPVYSNRYLNDALKIYLQKLIESSDQLEKYVAEWCLDNLVPIRKSEHPNCNWMAMTYEELVLNPIETIDLLCRKLDLHHRERLISRWAVPSKVTDSSTEYTLEKIKQGDRCHLVTKWKKSVSPNLEANLFNVLKRFQIDVYTMGEYLASPKWLHFATRNSIDGKPE
jgi:hypothetical protein